MGIISFVLWCVRKEPVWPGLPDFCLQAYGAGVGIKVGKGVVGNVNSYYSNRPAYIQRPVDYSSQNGGTK
jgi:hypothetical protein